MKKIVFIISLLILLFDNIVCVYASGWDHFRGEPQTTAEPEPITEPVVTAEPVQDIQPEIETDPEPVNSPEKTDDPAPVIQWMQKDNPVSGPSKEGKTGSGGKLKAAPEKVEEPDPLEGVETQKGVVYRQYPCGDDLSFMIVYQPIMTRSQSGQTAEGMFIFFRVQIQNLTDRTLSGLKYESFTLSKGDGENAEVYPLSPFFSQVTSYLWSLGHFRDSIPPRGTLDTYLVFDVQGVYNDPWVLTFLPTERFSNEQFTPIRLTLPPVNQQ